MKKISFELDEREQMELEEWKKHIVAIYGREGSFKFTFGTGSGIGTTLSVYSELANTTKEITTVDNW